MRNSTARFETIPKALRRHGWTRRADDRNRFDLDAGGRTALLRRRHCGSGWVQYILDGSPFLPAVEDPLSAHQALVGPWKLVRGIDRGIELRADVPQVIETEAADDDDRGTDSPVSQAELWCADLTGFLTGAAISVDGGETLRTSPAEIVAHLEQRGWPATLCGDAVQVTMVLPSVFRQVTISVDRSGTRLATELVDLAGWPQVCRQAALRLAEEANARVYLARLAAVGDADAEKLVAEVHLGSARIPGGWLDAALDALRAVVALLARELAALQDPEMAQLTLAARAA